MAFLSSCQLPAHIDERKIIQLIHPDKDVDGFHPMNTGRLVQGLPAFIPATHGIMLLLSHYRVETTGKARFRGHRS
ncbi:MAG: hypothetical protein U0T56_03285 [Ferruginibacter sp.]